MADENQTETIEKLVKRADGVVVAAMLSTPDGREYIASRNDMRVEDVTPYHAAKVNMPKNVARHVNLETVESLCRYIERFHNNDTVIFARIDANQIVGVIDYHGKPADNTATDKSSLPDPRLCNHAVVLQLAFSEEWATWTKIDGQLMSHRAFASFLEENSIDVVDPDGAALIDLCRDLQVINNVSFKSQIRFGDTTKIEFEKDNDAKSKDDVDLPVKIMLAIPVYFGEEPVRIEAFMRRQIDDGNLKLGIKLSRPETVRQDEFMRIVQTIEDTKPDPVTVLFGSAFG